MSDVVNFPAPFNARRAWDARALQTASMYGEWLLGDPLPLWALGPWMQRTDAFYRAGYVNPTRFDWRAQWKDFVNEWLAHDPRWQRAVDVKLAEVGDVV